MINSNFRLTCVDSFFLSGEARVTLFAGQSNARTFNYQPGDIGYVPAGFGKIFDSLQVSQLTISNRPLCAKHWKYDVEIFGSLQDRQVPGRLSQSSRPHRREILQVLNCLAVVSAYPTRAGESPSWILRFDHREAQENQASRCCSISCSVTFTLFLFPWYSDNFITFFNL